MAPTKIMRIIKLIVVNIDVVRGRFYEKVLTRNLFTRLTRNFPDLRYVQ